MKWREGGTHGGEMLKSMQTGEPERSWARQWDEAGRERTRCHIEFAQVTATLKI